MTAHRHKGLTGRWLTLVGGDGEHTHPGTGHVHAEYAAAGHGHGSHTHPELAALDARLDAVEAWIATHEDEPVPPPVPAAEYPPDGPLRYIPPPPVSGIPTPDMLNTKVVRIGQPGQRHYYSRVQPWNSDESLLYLAYGNVLLDGQTYAPVRTLGSVPGHANWSASDPALMYGTWDSETALFVLNVTTGAVSGEHDFGVRVSLGKGEGAISDTNRVAVQALDAPYTIWVYDVAQHAVVGTIVPAANPDNVTMSHDGLWCVVFYVGQGSGPGNGIWRWAADGSNGRQLKTIARHGDTAIDTAGSQVWVQCSPAMTMVDIASGTETTLLASPNAFVNGHVSGRNSARPGWAYLSDYLGSGTAPGTDQVAAVRLDGSGVVEVFAFAHRTGASYDTQPQATVSHDGGRALFASDYGSGSTPYCFVASA